MSGEVQRASDAMEFDRPVTVALVGAGARGKMYTRYALEYPSEMQVVAVAEPREFHRNLVAARHSLDPKYVFTRWEDLAAAGKIADAVIIATQDSLHAAPAVAFADLGCHILLEKPMAVTPEDCQRIVAAAKANGVMFAVCHVLRYTPYQQKIQEIIKSGVLGDIVNIQHMEPVGYWHFAHSYVRGNWRKESESSSMLMAKSCHDVDLLRYMMGRRCEAVSSFGSLKVFKPENAPEGAAARCVDCPEAVEASCPFSAKKVYGDRIAAGHTGFPVANICDNAPSVEEVTRVLRDGPYGRCVWRCDNDVVDHQVVTMEFEGGATASLTTVAFSEKLCVRHTVIHGSKGELEGDGEAGIRVFDFETGTATQHSVPGAPEATSLTGHNGADYFLIQSFVRAVGLKKPDLILSGCDETLESHMIVFAAEAARKERRVVDVAAYSSGSA